MVALPRDVRHTLAARAVTALLCDALDATTTYNEPVTPRSDHGAKKWRPFYGWDLGVVPGGNILDADGEPLYTKLERIFTHKPGDIVTSGSKSHANVPLKRYMVRQDQSLRLCTV